MSDVCVNAKESERRNDVSRTRTMGGKSPLPVLPDRSVAESARVTSSEELLPRRSSLVPPSKGARSLAPDEDPAMITNFHKVWANVKTSTCWPVAEHSHTTTGRARDPGTTEKSSDLADRSPTNPSLLISRKTQRTRRLHEDCGGLSIILHSSLLAQSSPVILDRPGRLVLLVWRLPWSRWRRLVLPYDPVGGQLERLGPA